MNTIAPDPWPGQSRGDKVAAMKTIIEPFRIKSVEPIRITDARERRHHLAEASYNLFRVPARVPVRFRPSRS